jgi:hypothetical protein
MSAPLSIRFDPGILDRLRRRASVSPGATPSGLAQRLVDEGLRQGEHPGVVFKDGPSGRRAALALGPDIWEVVRALREVDERGAAAIEATAELLALTPARVRTAVRYYSAYEQEILAEIAEADTASLEAERAWQTEQRLLE